MVKQRDLLRDLRRQGIRELLSSGRHAKLYNPDNRHTAPLPRHREIADFTAKAIYQQLGLPVPTTLTGGHHDR